MSHMMSTGFVKASKHIFGRCQNPVGNLTVSRSYQSVVPDLVFNNGHRIPQLGYGTWKTKPTEAAESVKCAIDVGYRHIDCAYSYANEREVGKGIRTKIKDGTVKREDLFVTAKLWNTYHRPENVEEGMQASLDDLGVDYFDLFIMHWPHAYMPSGRTIFPQDKNGKFLYDIYTSYMDTWKAMEDLLDTGKVKSIGLSNFKVKQLQNILDIARVKPAALQVECNPHMRQERLVAMCQENDLRVIGHSSIGSFDIVWRKPEDPYVLADPKVLEVSERVGKTPAQVALRWNIQRGIIVIPKSVTPSRIKSNFQVYDFTLGEEEMAILNSIQDNFFRTCSQRWLSDHPYYPFNDPN